jgi:two-component system sensor kinase FixL
LRIRQEFAEQLPEVLGDRVQLQQVLVNLIMNAQQAVVGLPDNRRDITLRAGVFSDEAVVVEVQDRGPGIDFSKGDVFEPFITSKPDGMGMGLPICRSLIESHGGSIWAENAPDGGACVRFTLPTAAARRDTK